MGKITKKYIGTDQVGSAQIELENGDSLRSKNSGGLSVNLLELDPSNLLQILQQPYLPGDASFALQAVPKQQLDFAIGGLNTRLTTAEGNITTLQSDVSTLQGQMSTAQGDISALQAEDLTFVKLDGSRPMTGDLSMMPTLGVHHKITGLDDPTDPRDAANKQYVDAVAEGLHVHAPVKVIINVSLQSASGGTVVYDNGVSGVGATLVLSVPLTAYDLYTFQDGDRVIVNGQSNQAYNGIYTVGSNGTLGSVFTRALDFNTPAEVAGGDFVFVQFGTLGGNTGWVEPLPVASIGVDPIYFVQFSGAGTYLAGDGLILLGNEFNVQADLSTSTTEINASNQVAVKLSPTGQLSTSASGVAISSAFQGRMSTAESNITALQTGKANINLDNLAVGDTSIPSGVNLRSLSIDQSLGFRLTTANQTSSVSGAIQVRTGSTVGSLSGTISIIPGLNSNANGASAATIVTGGALLRSGTITGGTQGSTGSINIAVGNITSGGVTGSTGNVNIQSGDNSGVGSTGYLNLVTGYNFNATAGSNSGWFYVNTGKALGGASGGVSVVTGAISQYQGLDNRTSTQPTGMVYIGSGDVNTPSAGFSAGATGMIFVESGQHVSESSSPTGVVLIRSGRHYGAGASGGISLESGVNDGTGATGTAQLLSGSISRSTSSALTGPVYVSSGTNNGLGKSGDTKFMSGGVTGLGESGKAELLSGIISNAASSANTGFAQIRSGNNAGAGSSGEVFVVSGHNTGSGNSGSVYLVTGDVVSGTRGKIGLEASIVTVSCQIDMFSHKIVNVTDPTAAQDAATKAYVDSRIASGTNFLKQIVTLSPTDISNGYIDLSSEHLPESTVIGVEQRVNLYETLDYVISVVSGVTRVTFAGPSAFGGAEALDAGQALYIQGVQA